MDLALELHMTVAELKQSMTEGEFVLWQHYARKKMLPARRLEMYLAQVAQVTAGGSLRDFILDRPSTDGGQAVIETVSKVAGLKRLGQGRKSRSS